MFPCKIVTRERERERERERRTAEAGEESEEYQALLVRAILAGGSSSGRIAPLRASIRSSPTL